VQRGPDLEAPLGTRHNPIRHTDRGDEVSYLNRLRCPDGSAPHAQHLAPRQRGPYGTLLDRFRVRCIYLNRDTELWFDHNHPGVSESRAPEGFSLVAPRPLDSVR
jgi:hypothetical protein